MSFLRSAVATASKQVQARSYFSSADIRIIGHLVKAESKDVRFASGPGKVFTYTVAVDNQSSMRKTDAQGNRLSINRDDITTSFFEVSGFNAMADVLEQRLSNVLPGSLLSVTAKAELRTRGIKDTVSKNTGQEIQVQNLALSHQSLDILNYHDPEVSEFKKQRAAKRAERQEQH